MTNMNLTQKIALAAQLAPAAARAAGSYYTPAIAAGMYNRLVAALQIGTLAGAASINCRWQHCSGSADSLAGWADISSTTCITSTVGSASNDKVQALELRLDQNPGTSAYVRALVSTATSTWIGGVTVWGEPRWRPATDHDTADVVQVVVY